MSFNSVDPVLFESVSAVTSTPTVDLGTKVTYDGKKYVYVQAKTAITAGYGVMPYGNALSYRITNAGTLTGTSNTVFAGLVEHTTFSTDSYGWLLVEGAGTFATAGATVTATAQKVSLTDDGKITTWVESATTGALAGYLLSTGAVATGAAASVFVKSEIY